jgi:cytoskeletal protein RodZ
MFEIGNSLREARLRQGLDLARVEDDTKIRAKYLQGLEDERFEVLPSETYVKGFLRTYAEYLGLDGQLYVDEYNSRFASVEEPVLSSPPSRRKKTRAAESNLLVAALAGIVAVAVLVVVAFTLSNDAPDVSPTAGLGPATTTTGAGETTTEESGGATPPPATAAKASLMLVAKRGDCWVTVRRGAPNGEVVFSGTIYQGETQRFTARRLWLEFGNAPSENLNVRLNGQLVRNFPAGEPVVIVTPEGVRAQT